MTNYDCCWFCEYYNESDDCCEFSTHPDDCEKLDYDLEDALDKLLEEN